MSFIRPGRAPIAVATSPGSSDGLVQNIVFTSQTPVDTYKHNDSKVGNMVWNSTGGVSATGCLRIRIPVGDAENSGAWRCPLNSSWSTDGQGFGTGDWWFQFRLKLGPHRLSADNGTNVEGFKILNLAEYIPTNAASSRSHPDNEIVLQQHKQESGVLLAYRELSNVGLGSAEFFEIDGFPVGGDIQHQNAIDNGSGIADKFARYCLYDAGTYDGSGMSEGCFRWVEGLWYTIDGHIKTATPGGTSGNVFEVWITPQGSSTRIKLYNMSGHQMPFNDAALPNGVNGMWLLPYKTRRTSGNFDTYQEYADVKVSTSGIISLPTALTLPSWVPSTIGTWATIPNSDLANVAPSPTPSGNTGPSSKIDTWTSFAIDPRTSQIYCAGNGGHSDYAGNEVDRLTLETESPSWAEIKAPSSSVTDSTYYGDGTPTSVHTYYGEHFYTRGGSGGKVLRIGGSRWNTGDSTTQFDSFDVSGNSWDASGSHPNVPSAVFNAGVQAFACCQDMMTENLWIGSNNAIYRFNAAANTFTTVKSSGGPKGEGSMSAFDTLRNRVLWIGGTGIDHHTYTVSTDTIATITLTGTSASSVSSIRHAGMQYIPELDIYLVRDDPSGGTVYQINADTFEVTSFSTTGGGSVPASGGTNGGVYHRWLYAPRLRSMIFVPDYGSDAWVLRVC